MVETIPTLLIYKLEEVFQYIFWLTRKEGESDEEFDKRGDAIRTDLVEAIGVVCIVRMRAPSPNFYGFIVGVPKTRKGELNKALDKSAKKYDFVYAFVEL